MKIYKHKNYKEYKKAQISKNKSKKNVVWIKPHELTLISKKIKQYIPDASFGLCHGVRNAFEVKKLRELLNIEIIGTEISPSAKKFPHTIQWDFHDIKDEWIYNVDFIYSNSFDHSYDPVLCLDVWMKCIKKRKGICFIHWSPSHVDKIDAADCFSASLKECRKMFNKKYQVVEEFGASERLERLVFIIKHKDCETLKTR